MLWDVVCPLAVTLQQFLGLLAQGSRYKGWGTTLADETHPGECHSRCVSILFHKPVEKHVGARACLPPWGSLLTLRTCTKPQRGDILGPLAPDCAFPVCELAPKEQHWEQTGLRVHSVGGCVRLGRVAEGSCVERSKASLFAAAVLFLASGIGAALLGDRRPFLLGLPAFILPIYSCCLCSRGSH